MNQYYGFIDTLVGREIERLGPDDVLLVVSAFGMEPLSPGKRVLEIIAGNPQISGTHERAPDGFVLAFGASRCAAAVQTVHRWSIWRRQFCISSGYRSAATWTALRELIVQTGLYQR